MDESVDEWREEWIALWRASPAVLPGLKETFTAVEQTHRERQLEQFLRSIELEFWSLPRTRSERQASRQRITSAFVRFARAGLELEEPHVDLLLDGGFSAIGTELARQARRFDPNVSTADILQANRERAAPSVSLTERAVESPIRSILAGR